MIPSSTCPSRQPDPGPAGDRGGLHQLHHVWGHDQIDPGKTRRDQLADARSWTASARIEMLYQKGVVDLGTIRALSKARKARNSLHHSGRHPASEDAYAAYNGVQGLLIAALDGERPALLDTDLTDHALIDRFGPPKPLARAPTHWMPIPKLPGEEELEREEANARGAI